MKATTTITAVLFGLAMSGIAAAQQQESQLQQHLKHKHRSWHYILPHPHYYHHRFSTYEEGILRGYAALIRARGRYNYATSLARINREEARSLVLDNQLKSTATYFEMRDLNRAARAAERLSHSPRPSPEDIARIAKDRIHPADRAVAIIPPGGKIAWPAALAGDEFAAERAMIDALFASRHSEDSGLGSENHRRIVAQISAIERKLRGKISSLGTSEYLAAKRFTGMLYKASAVGLDARFVAK